MKTLRDFVAKLDTYGVGVRFNINGDSSLNTVVGAIMTFITFLVVFSYGGFMTYNMLDYN